MRLAISALASKKASTAIIVTGSARSGTSITCNLLHSLNGVELDFEPPLLFSLFPLIGTLPSREWRLIFETYLYEGFLLGALSGRTINTNLSDDSSIFRVKSEEMVHERVSKSWQKVDLEKIAEQVTVAIKMPDIMPFLPAFQAFYPSTRIIVTKRRPAETISSILEKKWFADDQLGKNLIWPFHAGAPAFPPYWVEESRLKDWSKMSEVDRCAYYFIKMKSFERQLKNSIEVRYEDLVNDPHAEVKKISSQLNLTPTEMTEKLIETVAPSNSKINEKAIASMSSEYRSELNL